tara:strand:- start:453 stop:587 length:135 start_codon:yes stop_codon:yes gene_type:complete
MIDKIIGTVAGAIITVTITLGLYILSLWFIESIKATFKSKKKLK